MQDGSPELAAKAFIKLINSDSQPMHFITGKNAYNRELVEIKNIQNDMLKWSSDSQHLDYGDELYWL